MNAPTLDRNQWVRDLSKFTERNNARTIDIEVFTDDLGAQQEVHQMKLQGVAYDHHDGRLDIMVRGADQAHLTHSIGGIKGVEIMVAPRGTGDILSIEHDGGRTIVRPSLRASINLPGYSHPIDS
jgi:hypothetical protein